VHKFINVYKWLVAIAHKLLLHGENFKQNSCSSDASKMNTSVAKKLFCSPAINKLLKCLNCLYIMY
jgi:hypothetical protein